MWSRRRDDVSISLWERYVQIIIKCTTCVARRKTTEGSSTYICMYVGEARVLFFVLSFVCRSLVGWMVEAVESTVLAVKILLLEIHYVHAKIYCV